MLPELNNYDWEEAFAYASPTEAPPGCGVSTDAFSRDDVLSIAGIHNGMNDVEDWRVWGLLADGRWFILSAGCDYTGWGYQANGWAAVAKTRADLIRYGMGVDVRATFGLELED